ncbi:C2-domain-containing protein, partial [Gonapodya prolifera JEL478]
MPCVLRIRIHAARNLPVMDRVSELTDAYAEVRFADDVFRTQIARKTLSPIWNEDFRCEVNDDSLVKNEPLEIRVLDFDAFSANDPIGSVTVDLNPLGWDSSIQISGWFPLFDTLRGVRGEVSLAVRIDVLPEGNPFKETFGVQFFSASSLPHFQVQAVLGFVDIMDSDSDPEYHWVDSFRTPRTSNEARERVLFRLSNSIRRQLGRKAKDMGANAVFGYREFFDLEEDEREITVRGQGTAVLLTPSPTLYPLTNIHKGSTASSGPQRSSSLVKTQSVESTSGLSNHDNESVEGLGGGMDAQPLSTVTDLPLQTEPESWAPSELNPLAPPTSYNKKLLPSEQQLITIRRFPIGAILSIGGVVTARSVKLMDTPDDQRESWWQELREEVRLHAKAMGCTHVLGYVESAAIHDELYVLSATGTAAVLDTYSLASVRSSGFSSEDRGTASVKDDSTSITSDRAGTSRRESIGSSTREPFVPDLGKRKVWRQHKRSCQVCHIPYDRASSPFQIHCSRCRICKRHIVPDLLLATVEPPGDLNMSGNHVLVNGAVSRIKKRKEGELNASAVSDALPFLQYDLYRQLVTKCKIQGMNSLWGLRFQITV